MENQVTNDELKQLLMKQNETYMQNFNRLSETYMQNFNRLSESILDLQCRVKKIEETGVNAEIAKVKETLEDTRREIIKQEKFRSDVIKEISVACFDEIEDREVRKKNALIFGVPEIKEDSAYKTKEHDIMSLNSIIETVSPSLVGHPFRCYRVGNVVLNSSGSTKPRPLKIIMSSTESTQKFRNEFIKRKMASDIKLESISIADDKTKLQQSKYKQLKTELVERTRDGEKNLYIGRRNGQQLILTRTKDEQGDFQSQKEGRTKSVDDREQRRPLEPDK